MQNFVPDSAQPSSMVSSAMATGFGAPSANKGRASSSQDNGNAANAALDTGTGEGHGISFAPDLQGRHEGKKSTLLSQMGLNYNQSSFFSYYPMLRLFGYTAETLLGSGKGKDSAKDTHGKIAPEKRPFEFKKLATHPVEWFRNKKLHGEHGKIVAAIEMPAFFGLASGFGIKNFKELKEDTALAVSAEQGRDKEDIGIKNIRKSDNPIIASVTDRFMWQQGWRHAAALFFAGGVVPGILANSLLITQERTTFYRPLAYDILKKAVLDVQINNLGIEAKDELVDNLVRTMQATRLDHRREPLSKDDVEGLRPVLNRIANDIINKDFGFEGAVYIMGGGVLVPGNPELSESNYQHVWDVGVSGVAAQGQYLRQHSDDKMHNVWRQGDISRKGKGYIAESATDDALLKYREQLHSKGPAVAGAAGDSRRGSGERMDVGLVM